MTHTFRSLAFLTLTLAAVLGGATMAQGKKEVVWILTYSGGEDAKAAKVAKLVDDALGNVPEIASRNVDTTSRAIFSMAGGKAADQATIQKAIDEKTAGVKITSLKQETRETAADRYVIHVEGYADSKTSMAVRQIFERQPEITLVQPLPNGQIFVSAKKTGALDEAAARKALEGSSFKLVSFKKL